MPGSTPQLALPYPLPTDQVAQGASDIQALAEAIEAYLVAPRVQAGRATGIAIAGQSDTDTAVLFPVPFAAIPAVVATDDATDAFSEWEPGGGYIVTVSKTGFTYRMKQGSNVGIQGAAFGWAAYAP